MDDIWGIYSPLKSYNRSTELSPVVLISRTQSVTCDSENDVCIKHEKTDESYLPSSPTSLTRTPDIVLDRWIIKPLGDGICVEGHRR